MTCGIVSLSSLNYAIHLLPCHVNAAPPPAAPPYTLPPPFTSTIRLCEYGQRIRCCGGDLHQGRPARGRCRIPSCHPASPLAVGRAGKLTQAWGVWPLGWGGEGTRCNPPATRPGDAGHGCGKRCGQASCATVVEGATSPAATWWQWAGCDPRARGGEEAVASSGVTVTDVSLPGICWGIFLSAGCECAARQSHLLHSRFGESWEVQA